MSKSISASSDVKDCHMTTTLISHVYNEEYLLPFWLEHHKNMFDNIIIIDYHSTDKSVEICKELCPTCTILKSKNKWFDANLVDIEVMEIENNINGIKIILNTTEFLFCKKPVSKLFDTLNKQMYTISTISPYSANMCNVSTLTELIKCLAHDNVKFHHDRSNRNIHNFENGQYTTGRHSSKINNVVPISKNEAIIVWFGFFPMNEHIMRRKLQIKDKIPQSDKDNGYGFQHLFPMEKILNLNSEKARTGIPINKTQLLDYELIQNYINQS
jgi:hypothetical protein